MRVIFAIFLTSGGAMAQAQEWTGIYVGVGIAASRFSSDVQSSSSTASMFSATDTGYSISYGAPGGPVRTDFVTKRDEVSGMQTRASGEGTSDLSGAADLQLGAAYQLGWLVVGAQLEYGLVNAVAEASVVGASTSSSRLTATQSANGGPFLPLQDDRFASQQNYRFVDAIEIDWQASALVKGGVLLSPSLLAYGLVGVSRAGFRDAPFTTRDGLTYGLGLAYAFAPNWTVSGEIKRTEYEPWERATSDTQNFSGPSYSQQITSSSSDRLDLTLDAARLGVSYHIAPGQ